MYDLTCALKDFPWTHVTYNDVEPWREKESGWMEDLPEGWGDVIHEGLKHIDKILGDNDAKERLCIEQVKEKWGTLRFYFIVLDADGLATYDEPWIAELERAVHDMEDETGKVCCFCGTRDNLAWHGGWVHLACDACEKERTRREHAPEDEE